MAYQEEDIIFIYLLYEAATKTSMQIVEKLTLPKFSNHDLMVLMILKGGFAKFEQKNLL